MAFEAVVIQIWEGPSRWDTLLGSVWEGKPVRFHLVDKQISFPDLKPSEWLSARIMGVERAGNRRRESSPCELLLVRDAEILTPISREMTGLLLNGNYDMYTRKGIFTITERQYAPGDYFGGWKEGGTEFIKGPEVITFLNV